MNTWRNSVRSALPTRKKDFEILNRTLFAIGFGLFCWFRASPRLVT
jgi:hypothetical protein